MTLIVINANLLKDMTFSCVLFYLNNKKKLFSLYFIPKYNAGFKTYT
ncbi:hypothetical protein SAMN05444362_109150 [Dysgonomonas macrotermitis]|uniref:Uncharacterized protein n=1 Tax=Dysgonomonas macrotermitis TaxID=1346286 RepID=A0A1M5E533_9BACT|nr:hypothetical protein SAMN05444362_109150 [Dysgonomonas macrotermitis]